jgi:hypothetical protein
MTDIIELCKKVIAAPKIRVTDGLAQKLLDRIAELEANQSWLLNKVGVDSSGVYLSCGFLEVSPMESLCHLRIHVAKEKGDTNG